jgi:hypothetical protein
VTLLHKDYEKLQNNVLCKQVTKCKQSSKTKDMEILKLVTKEMKGLIYISTIALLESLQPQTSR